MKLKMVTRLIAEIARIDDLDIAIALQRSLASDGVRIDPVCAALSAKIAALALRDQVDVCA